MELGFWLQRLSLTHEVPVAVMHVCAPVCVCARMHACACACACPPLDQRAPLCALGKGAPWAEAASGHTA